MSTPTTTTSPSLETAFNPEQKGWLKGFIAGLAACGQATISTGSIDAALGGAGGGGGAKVSKDNPYPALLKTNRGLTKEGSGKDTRHFEIILEGSGLTYEVGDALGIQPSNWSDYVEAFLKVLQWKGDELIPLGNTGKTAPVREAFTTYYDITKPPKTLVEEIAKRSDSENLKLLLNPDLSGDLSNFLWGRETIDLFEEFPKAKFTPEELAKFLKKLAPRLYSISSSIKAHPGEVHLTIAVVRYESHGRQRKGVCSSYIAERVAVQSKLPVFMHSNKNFRLPADNTKPVIMVGPGTGIAPFRAFLEERKVTGAKGKNWLFFGDQKKAFDYLYQEELEGMQKDGHLARLDLAFSRDQEQKVYVQNRMLENSAEFYKWLEEGASMYVCGDASRMAKDVDQALHKIIEKEAKVSPEQATEYVLKMKSEKRYQRDVY
jgi:sulfite reductase (NADPH) flavoprotein alpha-component